MTGLPLSGITVLDFTHAAAGPFATMILGDLGARVLKVERPDKGDGARTMGRPFPNFPKYTSDYYLSLNRNKQALAIDIKKPAGVELIINLVQHSHIVVENFRPGVMERLGLGYDRVKEERAGLIYCSISAFGDHGPWKDRPGNDIIMQSISGLMGVTGEVGGGPVRMGSPVADFSTGLFALAGILAALNVREAHPKGQHVKVSMLESSLNMLCNYVPAVVGLGSTVPRLGRAHAQIVPYQAFECSDGEYVMVGAFTRKFWQSLCEAMGKSEWMEDPRFITNSARLENRDALIRELESLFVRRPREHWLVLLGELDVPASPVLELNETVRLEQVIENNSIIKISDSARSIDVARDPIRSEEWPEYPAKMPPDIGSDTHCVLQELLGLSSDEISELASNDIIAQAKERK